MTRKRIFHHFLVIVLCGALLVALPNVSIAETSRRGVKLVLQITIDQIRGDFVQRFGDRFVEGGFNYILDNGVHYANAHYGHANTETAVGHATLPTGAPPSSHGIIANDWIDNANGDFVYNTEDDRHHIIGADKKPHQGVSPRNLLSSTIGDEIVIQSGGLSRSFSVSAKDRGAILPGGHTGKAFWYSKSAGLFVSSTYYYDKYPDWVNEWNEGQPASRFRGEAWELINDPETYNAKSRDDRPYESDIFGFGRTFPHSFADLDEKYFTTAVGLTPMADELSVEFAKILIENEMVGQGDHLDYFAISLSSPDYAGHIFGPSSLEYEDTILRVDRMLADLFEFIDQKIGLDRTLVVLSADHAGPPAPEYASEMGMEAGRFPLDVFWGENSQYSKIFYYGEENVFLGHSHPYIYLNESSIDKLGLSKAEVERQIANKLMEIPGIRFVMTSSDIMNGSYPDGRLQRMIADNYLPQRSGHLYVVQEPYWFFHSTKEAKQMGIGSLASIHGSPWKYDTFVPLMFAGPGVPHKTVYRLVGPRDAAPTIAAFVGVNPPSASVGKPLREVLNKR